MPPAGSFSVPKRGPELPASRGARHLRDARGGRCFAPIPGALRRVGRLVRTFAEHRMNGIVRIAPDHQKRRLAPVAGSFARAHRDAPSEAGIRHDPAVVPPADVGAADIEPGKVALHRAVDAAPSVPDRPTVIRRGNDKSATTAIARSRERCSRG